MFERFLPGCHKLGQLGIRRMLGQVLNLHLASKVDGSNLALSPHSVIFRNTQERRAGQHGELFEIGMDGMQGGPGAARAVRGLQRVGGHLDGGGAGVGGRPA